MAKQEYNIGDHKQKSERGFGPGSGRHGMGTGEKANNFGQTMKQLVAYCNSYIPVILIALVLSFVGAALNVIGPDQLSKITDIIGCYRKGWNAISDSIWIRPFI
jgi:ATP-binding cassette, subfamily B, multidrug efflux pump